MGDAGSQASYGSQAVAHADFLLQAAQLSAIFKGINVSDGPLLRNDERGNVYIEGFFLARRGKSAHFTLRGRRVEAGQAVDKQIRDMPAIDGRGCALQQLLSGSIHQSDAAFHVSGDKAAADGVDYVLMQRLQAEQLTAFVAQLHARLPELGRQSAGEMRHREISEEVYQDDDLERLQVAARGNLK